MFGYLNYEGYTFICEILDYDNDSKECSVSAGGIVFINVPFTAVQGTSMSKLPWE